jgi:hypothetical protein
LAKLGWNIHSFQRENLPTYLADWATEVFGKEQAASIDIATHSIATAGKHILKIWMVDPGVVMDKIVIDFGGVKESYFGPPETLVGNREACVFLRFDK